ncbi:thiamine-phosphate kinase [Bacillus sp. JCM 19041]|uniref:thiamine-phosphate kinase n=1 Tax=Bacillus sp. JCM 19041 TaxID=1460637 RepID=UPI0006D21CF7
MNDEFSFIRSIVPKQVYQPRTKVGIGDDAAVYASDPTQDEVVCVDTMVEGVHFRKDTLTPYQIGRKVLAINVSDLAAMGATPLFYLVTLAVPADWTEGELSELYNGMTSLADRLKMDLIGGDTVSIPNTLVITITAIGSVAKNKSLVRSDAQVGDVVFATGPLGGSAAGFELLNERTKDGIFSDIEATYVKMHQQPEPQVEVSKQLAKIGKRIALNDISDGLSSESMEIAEASGVQLVLDEAQIFSISPQILSVSRQKRVEWSLNGGEDFQLVGTIAAADFFAAKSAVKEIGRDLFQVGTVRRGKPAVFLTFSDGESKIEMSGYNHFKRR